MLIKTLKTKKKAEIYSCIYDCMQLHMLTNTQIFIESFFLNISSRSRKQEGSTFTNATTLRMKHNLNKFSGSSLFLCCVSDEGLWKYVLHT